MDVSAEAVLSLPACSTAPNRPPLIPISAPGAAVKVWKTILNKYKWDVVRSIIRCGGGGGGSVAVARGAGR